MKVRKASENRDFRGRKSQISIFSHLPQDLRWDYVLGSEERVLWFIQLSYGTSLHDLDSTGKGKKKVLYSEHYFIDLLLLLHLAFIFSSTGK